MFSKNILYFIFEKKKQFLIDKRIFQFFSSLKNRLKNRKLFLKTAIKHTLNFFQKYFLNHDS